MRKLYYILLLFLYGCGTVNVPSSERVQKTERTIEQRLEDLENDLQRIDSDVSLYYNILNQRIKSNKDSIRINSERLTELEPSDSVIVPPVSDIEEIAVSDYNWQGWSSPNYTPDLLEEITDGEAIIKRVAVQPFHTNKYAKHQAFSHDNTMFKASTNNGTAIHDAQTGEVIKYVSAPNFGNWYNTRSDVLFGVTSGTNQFKHLQISNNQTTVIRTFSNYSSVSIGDGEGRISLDDKYLVLLGNHSGGRDLIVYNVKDNVIEATKTIPTSSLDWATITPSGQYVVVSYVDDGSGSAQGLKRYNRDLTNLTHLTDWTNHGDFQTDVNGDDTFLGVKGNPYLTDNNQDVFLYQINIKTGYLAYDQSKLRIYGGHISGTNTNQQGWIWVSESCCPTSSGGRPSLHAFPIKLNYQFDTIGRPIQTNALKVSGTTSSPMYAPSRDGKKGVFNSYWDDNGLKSAHPSYAPMWLVKMQLQWWFVVAFYRTRKRGFNRRC